MDAEPYFDRIRDKTESAFDVAEEARSQNRDPEPRVDIPVAEDLPEKASSLVIAAKFPELEGQGVADRIRELEDEFGKNDERVAFEIAREIAEGRFHEFEELERACNAGIRVGVSYMTGGITTAPLEGIGDIKIRENSDGTDYLAVYYSGPIRSAGGTASAMSVLLSDYVRKNVDLDEFKPSDTVIDRYATEVDDYYNRVTAKQYYPEREETGFIAEHVPIEVTGGPTRDLEVTNHKDLDRVETNQIRGGMCLVYLDGLPLKAPKIKKRIEKWGKEFGLEHWEWIKEYLELQEEIHSSDGDDTGDDENEDEPDYTPSDKFLGSMTAGRPVFSHPGEKGGFRLRYGHSRVNGLAAASFHPATMEITERFIATGTQLKTEYPMKGTVATPCDAAHPPVVRLEDGSVERVESRERARQVENDVDEILFLGDMLVAYGEFVENGKDLLPSPYVSEWWEKELERSLEEKEMKLGKDFSGRDPTPSESAKISRKAGVPFHPRWTHHWRETSPERFKALHRALERGRIEPGTDAKQCLEDILASHRVEDGEVVVEERELEAMKLLLKPSSDSEDALKMIGSSEDIPEFIEEVSGIEVREQAPHYIGARMGRPEKAERRTIKGKPQLLFPCGKQEGGRMRNLIASYERGEVKEQIIHNRCTDCEEYSYFSYCLECGSETEPRHFCSDCGHSHSEEPETCEKCGGERFNRFREDRIDVRSLVDRAMKNVGMEELPELLKSVRGMSAKHKHVEPVEKGLLRQKHDLYVNKDGTVRYDATDLPMSHFTPEEIDVSVEKLREIGYREDVGGRPLESDDQVLEMKPQDIVIPDGDKSLAASDYFVRVANFVDDLLEDLYGLEPYYDVEEKEDLVGELVIGLAPHTSGGTVGRIIGFTDAKGIYSHPYWHAAKRRNCLPGDTEVKMADGTSKSLKEIYASAEDEKTTDSTGTREKEISKEVISIDEGSVADSKASKVIKTPAQDHKIEIKTESGRKLQTFPDHRLKTSEGVKRAREVEKDDNLLVPAKMPVEAENAGSLDLLELVGEDYMLRGISETTDRLIKDLGGLENASQALGIAREALENYRHGDSVPKETLDELADRASIDIEIGNCAIADKGDKIELERYVEVDSEFMRLLGYYLAGGYTRKSEKDGEQVYQVRFAYGEKELKNSIRSLIETVFEVEPSEGDNVLAVSSRAIYELFKSFGAGSEAHEKRVPEFAKKLPEDKISEMLSAYFSGDGSVEKGRLHVQATNVSRGLLQDVDTLLKRFGIYARYSQSERKGGGILVENFGKEKNKGRTFVSHKLHIRSSDARKFGEEIGFDLETKQSDLEYSYEKIRKPEEHRRNGVVMEKVQSVEVKRAKERFMYDLEVEDTHNFVTSDNIVTNNCDGDEDAILLLMDGLLNFSRQFLPDITGARTMDAPLILSTVLNPDEIDDEAWAIETVSEYPLEFYEETLDYKPPWELETDIEIGEDVVYGDEPFSHGYTHESRDVENAPNQSEYVTLDEMSDKTKSQLGLGRKIKAVDADDTAELLLKKHFIPDIKGNLRSFSSQEMRCVDCNEKFRRVPLRSQTIAPTGKTTAECPECEGKVLLTISEGTIKKYMRPSEDIIDEYEISPYVRQQILILKQTLQSLFGKEKRQSGLKQFT